LEGTLSSTVYRGLPFIGGDKVRFIHIVPSRRNRTSIRFSPHLTRQSRCNDIALTKRGVHGACLYHTIEKNDDPSNSRTFKGFILLDATRT
jgi:hypothetical protein